MLLNKNLAAAFCLEDECAWYIKPEPPKYYYKNVLTGEDEPIPGPQPHPGVCAIMKIAGKLNH